LFVIDYLPDLCVVVQDPTDPTSALLTFEGFAFQ